MRVFSAHEAIRLVAYKVLGLAPRLPLATSNILAKFQTLSSMPFILRT